MWYPGYPVQYPGTLCSTPDTVCSTGPLVPKMSPAQRNKGTCPWVRLLVPPQPTCDPFGPHFFGEGSTGPRRTDSASTLPKKSGTERPSRLRGLDARLFLTSRLRSSTLPSPPRLPLIPAPRRVAQGNTPLGTRVRTARRTVHPLGTYPSRYLPPRYPAETQWG